MRRLLLAALLATLGIAGSTSCGETYSSGYDFVRTATVSLGQQVAFIVDAPVQLVVMGQPRSTDLIYNLSATVTASSATVARNLAELVKITTEEVEPNAIRLTVEGLEPGQSSIEGLLQVWLPQDMHLIATAQTGPLLVSEMHGDMNLNAATSARVQGAKGSVRVAVENGNAIVSTQALPSTLIEVYTNSGDAQVLLPGQPSVSLQAQAGGGGQILVRHPAMPRHVATDLPYGTVVAGGLCQVVMSTRIGNIAIDVGP